MSATRNDANEEEIHRQNYARILALIPDLVEKVDQAIRVETDPKSLSHSSAHDDYGYLAISTATVYLSSAVDALKTLSFLKSPDNPSAAAVTVNGTAALVRQALECSAVALWILETSDREILRQRGFAALWSDAIEQKKFSVELEDLGVIQSADLRIEQLTRDGISSNYFKEENMPKLNLKISVEDSVSILRKTRLNPTIVTPEVLQLGAGYSNAAWLYRFTSGQTHGRRWATVSKATRLSPALDSVADVPAIEKIVAITRPNYLILGLAVTSAREIILEAMVRLNSLSQDPI